MKRTNVLKTAAAVLMVTGMLFAQSLSAYAEEEENTDARQLLEEEALEQAGKYGFMSVGTTEFPAENRMADILLPEEVAEHDHGILFTDIHDYDGDGTPELLVFRRQDGYVNFERFEYLMLGIERSEYLFEMYEDSESGFCLLSSRFVAGAADVVNLFTSHTSMTVFRRDREDGTDLFMEVFSSEQDHPEDMCLLRLQYKDGRFCNYSGIRYGALFFGEDNVRYLEPKSTEAFGILCYPGSAIDRLWDLRASSDTYDEAFISTLKSGLKKYGLTLLTTRYEAENPKECSALDLYGTEEGELIPLAFTYLHWDRVNDVSCYKLSREVYTDDPEGADRPVMGS